jgi:hypothetical protein
MERSLAGKSPGLVSQKFPVVSDYFRQIEFVTGKSIAFAGRTALRDALYMGMRDPVRPMHLQACVFQEACYVTDRALLYSTPGYPISSLSAPESLRIPVLSLLCSATSQ